MSILAQKGDISWALQPTNYGTGTVPAQSAKTADTFLLVPTAADTFVLGSKTYTFVASVSIANDVLIGTDIPSTLSNLVAAIMAGAGSGTAYGTGTTANAQATADYENDTLYLTTIAQTGAANSVVHSKTGTSYVTLGTFSGGQTGGAFPTLTNWVRHRAIQADYDVAQIQGALPLEISPNIEPTGWYKGGAYLAGGFQAIPRFENSLGTLLFAALGTVTTATDSPVSGANTHTFIMDPTNQDVVPLVAVRKHVPGTNQIAHQGIVGYDNKIASMQINIPASQPIEMRVGFLGRYPQFDNHPDSWIYQNTYEDFSSIGLGCRGSFKLPALFANALPVTNVVVELSNGVTTPQQEMIVGSFFMDDIAVRTRLLSFRFMYKWYDPELYQRSQTNAKAGVAWSSQPFQVDTSGGNYAIDVIAESANVIGVTTQPYQLEIRANRVIIEPQGPIQLMPGQIIMQEYRATVIVPASGNYAEFILTNHASGYALPSIT